MDHPKCIKVEYFKLQKKKDIGTIRISAIQLFQTSYFKRLIKYKSKYTLDEINKNYNRSNCNLQKLNHSNK